MVMRGAKDTGMGEECKGVEIQPMSREGRHCGGQQERAAVTCSPDSCGIHSLIGVIDTSLRLRYCSGGPKRAFLFPIPDVPNF